MTKVLLAEYAPTEFSQFDKDALKLKPKILKFAKDFCLREYGVKMNIPIEFRYSKTSTQGRFRFFPNTMEPYKIIINLRMVYYLALGHDEEFYAILKHELIHYCLFMTGKPFDDGDDYFERELAIHGAVSSATTSTSKRFAAIGKSTIFVLDEYTSSNLAGQVVCRDEYRHTRKNYSGFIMQKINNESQLVKINLETVKIYVNAA